MITLGLATEPTRSPRSSISGGPLSVVAAGLQIGDRGPRDAMSERMQTYVFAMWTLIDDILNSIHVTFDRF